MARILLRGDTTSLHNMLSASEQQRSSFDLAYTKLASLIESPSFQKAFSELTTTSERIKFVLSHEAVTRLISDYVVRGNSEDDDNKNVTKATEFGQDGNRSFQARRYEDALVSYSSAIRYAPQDGSLLPIAFGSRSGVFFQLKQYEAALKDIEVAQSHAQYKPFFMLTIRKCQCLVRLGRVAQAKKILYAINRDDLNKGDTVLLDKFYQRERDNLNLAVEKEKDESKEKDIEPELLKNVSSVIKILSEKGRFEPQPDNSSLSSKVEIRYDEKNGRHLVTTQDVHFGDILAVTKPYAAVLTNELVFCHHCFASLKPIPDIFPRTVPCTDCSRVLYCSEHCRTESWQEYHRFECSLAWNSFEKSILNNSNASNGNYRLALRTLFVAGGLDSICAVSEKFPAASYPSKSADFAWNVVDYYENVYRMEMKECDSIKEHVMKIISVACMFEWSKLAEINDENKTESPNVAAASEKDIFEMETLLRHYLQIFKRETIFMRSDQSALDDPNTSVEYITTLDPLIGLAKESCNPNMSIIVVDCVRAAPHVSNVCVFFANKPIPAGTVLTIVCSNYGDSVVYRLYHDRFLRSRQYIWNQVKFLHPCEHCEGKRRESPFGFITTIDGYELVCCGANCDGFIRRTDGDQVNCCNCKRDIGPFELAAMKMISLGISKFYSEAKELFGRIKTLVENDKEVLPNLPEDFGTMLLQLETLINDRIAPLALKHSRLLLVDLYKQLGTYYWYFHRRKSNKFDYLVKGWKYVEASHTTLEVHFGGGDSLDLLKLLQENVDRFFKRNIWARLLLDDPNGQFSFLNLDDNDGERRNMLVRFVESYGAAKDRLCNMNECYKII